VVLDRRLRTPAGARLFAAGGEGSAVVIYTEETEPGRVHALTARGATVVRLQPVTPASVLEDLWSRRVHRVLVEGGGEVLGAFLDQRLYDQVVAIAAPVLVGGRAARGPVLGEGVAALGDAPRLEGAKVRRLGEDVAISGLRPGCLQELSLGLDG
jgi:diaminohydroxyphosphoribosylaminopyrimidine deaminase/5-amino-6-(5-phosphoribosylamino)uracil reductase